MLNTVLELLNSKGVKMDDMIDIVYDLQIGYNPKITREQCEENILAVLRKREAQYAILTGLEIDRLVTEGQFREPIQSIIASDEGRYGIDEMIALSITYMYGSIGNTTFGYVDKLKPGIIGKLDSKENGECNTFIDDIVGGIVAAASSRLAHSD